MKPNRVMSGVRVLRTFLPVELLVLIAAVGLAITAWYGWQLYQAASSAPTYGDSNAFEGKEWTDSDGRKFRDWVITKDPRTGKAMISTPTD